MIAKDKLDKINEYLSLFCVHRQKVWIDYAVSMTESGGVEFGNSVYKEYGNIAWYYDNNAGEIYEHWDNLIEHVKKQISIE